MTTEPLKRDASLDEVLAAGELSEEKRKKVEELIEEEEGATNRLGGWLGKAVIGLAVFVSVFHLYAAAAGSPFFGWAPIVPTYNLRPIHVAMVLTLVYLLFPMFRAWRNRVTPLRLAVRRRQHRRRRLHPLRRAPSSASAPSIPTGSTSTSASS